LYLIAINKRMISSFTFTSPFDLPALQTSNFVFARPYFFLEYSCHYPSHVRSRASRYAARCSYPAPVEKMSSESFPKQPKPAPPSDISQVLSFGPAVCETYGKFLGVMLMLFALAKTRTGGLSILTTIAGASFIIKSFWK
jgi:hypothetical protein